MMHSVKCRQELMAGRDWIWFIGFSKHGDSWVTWSEQLLCGVRDVPWFMA